MFLLCTDCSLESEVLRAECSRLQTELSAYRAEEALLERQVAESQALNKELEHVGRDTQQAIDTLMAVVRAVVTLGHSNDWRFTALSRLVLVCVAAAHAQRLGCLAGLVVSSEILGAPFKADDDSEMIQK